MRPEVVLPWVQKVGGRTPNLGVGPSDPAGGRTFESVTVVSLPTTVHPGLYLFLRLGWSDGGYWGYQGDP